MNFIKKFWVKPKCMAPYNTQAITDQIQNSLQQHEIAYLTNIVMGMFTDITYFLYVLLYILVNHNGFGVLYYRIFIRRL